MKRRRWNAREKEENEDKKRECHDHNEHETEDNRDKLSDMPECVLIRILSFLKAKEAVQTCILSSTWKHLWKHLPALRLKSSGFKTAEGFMNFVNGILTLRDFSTALNALHFKHDHSVVEPDVLESIVSHAASHNVNHLRLSVDFPPGPQCLSSLSSCHSLISLNIECEWSTGFPNSLNLPALTYLKLRTMAFYAGNDGRVEPFSTFKRLHTLILSLCQVRDVKPLSISSTTLLNLTMHNYDTYTKQQWCSNIELFAPRLHTFDISCMSSQKVLGTHLSSIKQVTIDVYDHTVSNTLLNWFTEMTNIETLIVTPQALQALSLFPDGLFKLKLTSWCNLKSLKVNLTFPPWRRLKKFRLVSGKSWKEDAKLRERVKAKLKLSPILVDAMFEFLLQNSPSAEIYILGGPYY